MRVREADEQLASELHTQSIARTEHRSEVRQYKEQITTLRLEYDTERQRERAEWEAARAAYEEQVKQAEANGESQARTVDELREALRVHTETAQTRLKRYQSERNVLREDARRMAVRLAALTDRVSAEESSSVSQIAEFHVKLRESQAQLVEEGRAREAAETARDRVVRELRSSALERVESERKQRESNERLTRECAERVKVCEGTVGVLRRRIEEEQEVSSRAIRECEQLRERCVVLERQHKESQEAQHNNEEEGAVLSASASSLDWKERYMGLKRRLQRSTASWVARVRALEAQVDKVRCATGHVELQQSLHRSTLLESLSCSPHQLFSTSPGPCSRSCAQCGQRLNT